MSKSEVLSNTKVNSKGLLQWQKKPLSLVSKEMSKMQKARFYDLLNDHSSDGDSIVVSNK